jgi:ubiquinone/menaquinone biosynthesis C-methylase UbiE
METDTNMKAGLKFSKKCFHQSERNKISPDKLPFENESQDVILAVTALHEILDHEKRVLFFKEAKRILKKGGLIIVSEQFRDTPILFSLISAHFIF